MAESLGAETAEMALVFRSHYFFFLTPFNCNLRVKGEVRIAKKDFDDEKAKRFGPLDRYYMNIYKNRVTILFTLDFTRP